MSQKQILKLSFVKSRLVETGKLDISEWTQASTEFHRFIQLACRYRKPLAMIGPKVDLVWHEFILFTEKYAQFCKKEIGFFFHHNPNSPSTPVTAKAISNFFFLYQKDFGDIPSIWFSGLTNSQIKRLKKVESICGNLAESVKAQHQAAERASEVLKWSGWIPRLNDVANIK